MNKNFLSYINLILILIVGGYVVVLSVREKKKVYVLNQRVFNEFAGKKDLETKLLQMKNASQASLDSLGRIVQSQPRNQALALQYEAALRSADEQYGMMSEKYTADIWKRINQYTAEFGKENGYEFIFGASGDGNLMYADDSNNITDQVIKYINEKYNEGESN